MRLILPIALIAAISFLFSCGGVPPVGAPAFSVSTLSPVLRAERLIRAQIDLRDIEVLAETPDGSLVPAALGHSLALGEVFEALEKLHEEGHANIAHVLSSSTAAETLLLGAEGEYGIGRAVNDIDGAVIRIDEFRREVGAYRGFPSARGLTVFAALQSLGYITTDQYYDFLTDSAVSESEFAFAYGDSPDYKNLRRLFFLHSGFLTGQGKALLAQDGGFEKILAALASLLPSPLSAEEESLLRSILTATPDEAQRLKIWKKLFARYNGGRFPASPGDLALTGTEVDLSYFRINFYDNGPMVTKTCLQILAYIDESGRKHALLRSVSPDVGVQQVIADIRGRNIDVTPEISLYSALKAVYSFHKEPGMNMAAETLQRLVRVFYNDENRTDFSCQEHPRAVRLMLDKLFDKICAGDYETYLALLNKYKILYAATYDGQEGYRLVLADIVFAQLFDHLVREYGGRMDAVEKAFFEMVRRNTDFSIAGYAFRQLALLRAEREASVQISA